VEICSSQATWSTRARADRGRLLTALAITATFFVVEVIGGLLSGSLALLSDAGHMLADSSALLLALFAVKFAALPATPEKSYGYYRLEILSALANGVLLGVVAVFVLIEAVRRLGAPRPIDVGPLMIVAGLGLLSNLAVALLLHGSKSLNLRGAYLHVLGDLLSSIGVLIGGLLVHVTGEARIDAAVAAGIALVILASAVRLTRDAVDVLLEAIPKGITILDVNRTLLATEGVIAVHDVHVWSLTTGVEALSAHVLVERADLPQTDRILADINRALADRFQIEHSTIQVETDTAVHSSSGHD